MTKKIQLEEARDYELTKLRLWEEYQVKSIEMEYHQALQKAKENHDKMIKLIKEKLYDKLQKQIKTLKEDKYLLNLLNSNSYNHDKEGGGANRDNETLAAAMGLNFHDRRSLRKRGEYLGRFATGEMDDLSDGGGGGLNGNLSWARNGSGYISLGKRRRLHTTRYSSNDEVSAVRRVLNHGTTDMQALLQLLLPVINIARYTLRIDPMVVFKVDTSPISVIKITMH